jgi:hypothetical protein
MTSLAFQVEKVVGLDKDDSSKGIIRLPKHYIDSSKSDRSKFHRRELVTILNLSNGRRVVRYVMGNSRYDLTGAAAALDYDTRDALGVRFEEEACLVVKRATIKDKWWYYWNSDDPAVRIANRLGGIAILISLKDLYDIFASIASFMASLFG